MKVLITGNMGYIGPVMSRHFLSAIDNVELIGLDPGFFGHCLTGANVLPEARFHQQIFKDLRDVTEQDLADVDAVVHLAAISNDPMGNAFEAVTEDINLRGSLLLAETAKKSGVSSFVFASSCSVYGYAEGKARDETSELNPLTAYARSKIGTEHGLEKLADDNFTVTCLRFPTACGMSDRLRLDLVLNDFVAAAISSKQIIILSDGTPWRPLIDVQDMSRAAEWGVKRSADNGGEFLSINVGRTAWNYQVRDLADAVKEIVPDVEIDVNTDAAPDKRSYQVDFSRYEELAPNHQPQIDLQQTIRELKSGLEAMNFSDNDFRSSQLIRLHTLQRLRDEGYLDDNLRHSR